MTPPVAQLIGTSRARLLELLDRPMTTTGLAGALRMAPSTASRHASVLREAGLLTSHRHGNRMMHHRTQLGTALLDGPAPEAVVHQLRLGDQQLGTPGSHASETSMKMFEM